MPPRLFASDAEIVAIGEGLLDRTLPKPGWTHAAHFAAAVWILVRRPDLSPERDLPGIIRAYNEATGVANTDSGGYHETITQASLRAARAFLAALRPAPRCTKRATRCSPRRSAPRTGCSPTGRARRCSR